MNKPAKDFFSFAREIISACERNDFVVDQAHDSPLRDKTARIVTAPTFPSTQGRYLNVTDLLSTLFIEQLAPEQKGRINQDYVFAATRREGRGAFFIQAPESQAFDFAAMQTRLNEVQAMFQPLPLSRIPQQAYQDHPERVCVGPVKASQLNLFENVLGRIAAFHGIREDFDAMQIPASEGDFYIFRKSDYARLIKDKALLAETAPRAGTIVPPPPPGVN